MLSNDLTDAEKSISWIGGERAQRAFWDSQHSVTAVTAWVIESQDCGSNVFRMDSGRSWQLTSTHTPGVGRVSCMILVWIMGIEAIKCIWVLLREQNKLISNQGTSATSSSNPPSDHIITYLRTPSSPPNWTNIPRFSFHRQSQAHKRADSTKF